MTDHIPDDRKEHLSKLSREELRICAQIRVSPCDCFCASKCTCGYANAFWSIDELSRRLEEAERSLDESSTETENRLRESLEEQGVELMQALTKLTEAEAKLKEAKMAFGEYATHKQFCPAGMFECGEPTPSGGYRSKYAGKWYERNEEPPCDCGMREWWKKYIIIPPPPV